MPAKKDAKPAVKPATKAAAKPAAKPVAKPVAKPSGRPKKEVKPAIWGCYECGHENRPESKTCWDCENTTYSPSRMRWLDPSTGNNATDRQIRAVPKELRDRVSKARKEHSKDTSWMSKNNSI